jgi:hypothetical protein
MLVRDFASTYRAKTDDELLQLEEAGQMSPEAMAALRGEWACRRIEPSDTSFSNLSAEIAQPAPIAMVTRSGPGIRSFVEDILIVYQTQFWIFFQLSAVAAVAGYMVLAMRRYRAVKRSFER